MHLTYNKHYSSLLFLLILLFVMPSIYGEDNLEIQIRKAKGKRKVELMNKIAEEKIDSGQYDIAENYLDKSLKTSEKMNYADERAKALFLFGEIYYNKDENENAKKFYFKASDAGKALKDKDIYCRALQKLGATYYYSSQYDSALLFLDSALLISKKEKFELYTAKIYQVKGRVLRQLNKPDEAIKQLNLALEIFNKLENKEGMANTYEALGRIYNNIGKNNDAIIYYQKTLELSIQLNDDKEIAFSYVNIGNAYWNLGLYDKAIEFQQDALKYFQKTNDIESISDCFNNIGACYENLLEENSPIENIKNLNNAKDYYKNALEYRLQLKDSAAIANSYLNLGNVESRITMEEFIKKYGEYYEDSLPQHLSSSKIMSYFNKGFDYWKIALRIYQKLNDKNSAANLIFNIGKIQRLAGKLNQSKESLENALKNSVEADNSSLEAVVMNELGLVYKQQQMYKQAIEYLNNSLKICLNNGFISTTRYIYQNLSIIYEKINEIDLAFSYYKKFIQVQDEVINEQKYKKINELETRYQTKQKEDEIKLLNQKDQLSKTKIKQARLVIIFVSFGIAVVIVFMILIFKQYQDKRKANIVLEEKNILITKQKQDITDSIMYASKIQSAVLPPDEILKGYFKDYFILYLPKDIVSGDFYWVTEYEGKIIFAAADCTGHGVPGAFMSMLGTAFLNEIVSKYKGLHANEILNELRLNIIKSLHQKEETQERKDGMDISLTMINLQTFTAEYAGAYNPLLICRDSELIEYKADRQPVGIYKKTMESFTNHSIQLKPNDCLYSFSDGYVDQFGSDNKRKFMIKNLKDLLLKIQAHNMITQKQLLYDNYIKWKGAVEQIDDVLLLGIKI